MTTVAQLGNEMVAVLGISMAACWAVLLAVMMVDWLDTKTADTMVVYSVIR